MAKLEAREIQNSEVAEFNGLAKELGGVFGHPQWFDTFGANAKRIGLFQKDGQLVGGFFCSITALKVIKVVAPMRFTPHCVLFFNQPSSNAAAAAQHEKSVGKAISNWLLSQPVKTVLLPFPWSYSDMQSFAWDGFRVSPKFTYRLSLKAPIEKIKSNCSQATKSSVKKAEKSGVSVELCNDAQVVNDLLKETLASKSGGFELGLNREELVKLFESSLAFALVAEHQGQAIATGVFVYDQHTCYYLLGGVNRAFSKLEGGTAVIWTGIQKAQELGCEVFDFEGSMNPGIEHFFRGFGGQLTPYFQLAKAPFIQKAVLRYTGRKEF